MGVIHVPISHTKMLSFGFRDMSETCAEFHRPLAFFAGNSNHRPPSNLSLHTTNPEPYLPKKTLQVGGVVAAGVLIKVVSLLRRFCGGGSTGLAGRRPMGSGGWGGGAVRGLLGVPGWMTSWMKSSRYYSYSQLSTSEMLLEEDDDDNDDFAMAGKIWPVQGVNSHP